MVPRNCLLLLLLLLVLMPLPAYPAQPTYPISTDVQTTRQRTVRAVAIPGAEEITITQVDQYAPLKYSLWEPGAPNDYGWLLPNGAPAVAQTPVEPLLNFFTISDIHITDKDSPAGCLYPGTVSTFGNVTTSAYSPIILSTTHVLDAAVQTINALHAAGTPTFDFGMSLGDDANSTQYNELRWFLDVIDGKRIVPSSGAHVGAGSIDYQRPYQAAGLDKSIPWYAVMGNHDQFWSGSLFYTDYLRRLVKSNTVLDAGQLPGGMPTFETRGFYMGTIDGSTPFGDIINAGADSSMPQPIVVADPSRRSLTTSTSTTLNWMREFFNTTTKPKGHGFTKANLDSDFACYTFEPKASVPLKVIVLDDTCKENPYAAQSAYARGCLDQQRYDWLVNELELGQAQGKLMIVAAHVPVGPQTNVPDAPWPANSGAANLPNDTVVPVFLSACTNPVQPPGYPCNPADGIANNGPVPPYNVVSDAQLLAKLHNYSNLILWLSGHRHISTVTPQPGPSPEFGFWEVETPSLRDFPQQFRTFEITRNAENTVTIRITNVDPAVQEDSPAFKSRGYAIGANRISAGTVGQGLTDTTAHVFNADLIKPLAAPYTMTVNVTGPGTVAMGPYQAATCTASTPCTGKYLPGTAVTLTPTPTPGSGAVFAGWSACSGNSTCNITMTGNVTLTATFTNAPTLSATPAPKGFGNVKIGSRAVATFTVKNTKAKGNANLVIGTATITGTNANQFAVVAGKDRCSGRTLAPNKTCTLQVSFSPTSAYSKSATLSIPSNDPATPSQTLIWGAGR